MQNLELAWPFSSRAALETSLIVVLMGVMGSGKTTIGTLLAKRLGTVFADADDFHSPANKQKMAAGHPLTDEDRQPWLERLNGMLRDWYQQSLHAGTGGGVLACSALKERYRTTLASGMPQGAVNFVLLDGSSELFAERLAHRHHEFMSPQLLDSQLETLEPPTDALRVVNDRPPEQVTAEILEKLRVPASAVETKEPAEA